MDTLAILVFSVVTIFAALIFSAVYIQPRLEREASAANPDDAWASAGLGELRSEGFDLYQIVPTESMMKAEFYFRDQFGQEIGRYTTIRGKSGTILCGNRTMQLYIQGSGLNRTIYAGKVGGTANDSIVVRDDNGVVAEIWRTKLLPGFEYCIICGNRTVAIRVGGLSPTKPGTIEENGQQIGAFRRPRLVARNVFVAFRKDVPDYLKCVFCSVLLLQ